MARFIRLLRLLIGAGRFLIQNDKCYNAFLGLSGLEV